VGGWRASRQAKLKTIPAIVRDVPEDRRLVHQLMENILREDLNAVDRAAALRSLKVQMGHPSWDEVAAAVALKRSRLFQLLGTEKLPEPIQEDIRAGRLSEKQSRALQGLDYHAQLALRDAIVADALPAHEAQRLARLMKASNVPDDPEAAALKLVELRIPARPVIAAEPEDALALLDLIARAASGGARERSALSKAAANASAAPFDAERLQEQIHGLARTLSRMPPEQLDPGTLSHSCLRALHGTLGALLD
jgi:ParB family chromosome partitioning protein